MHHEQRRKLSVPEVARRLVVNEDKVRFWIVSGELRAVNVATRPTGRPRWRIDEADLIVFENRRAARTAAPNAPRRRRQAADVISFF